MWHIHQGPSISFKLCVVIGTIDDTLDFIHVGFPIYLSVWREKKQTNKKTATTWIDDYEQIKEEPGGLSTSTENN